MGLLCNFYLQLGKNGERALIYLFFVGLFVRLRRYTLVSLLSF